MRQTATAERIKKELPDITTSNEVNAALKEWFAADEAFNVWFLETTKGALDDAKLLGLVEGYGGDQDSIEDAWDDYVKGRNDEKFIASLATSRAKMDELKLK